MDIQISNLLLSLGIDPAKPNHLSDLGEAEDGLRLYMGSYHFVGELLAGPSADTQEWNDANTTAIENITFTMNHKLSFVDEAMPKPILQLDFETKIPWVLTDKPE